MVVSERPAADAWKRFRDRKLARGEIPRGGEQSMSSQSNPEALCICGLAGIWWRPRKGGGRRIFRCEEHRCYWPDYADPAPSQITGGRLLRR
jgi:hypothetical protein